MKIQMIAIETNGGKEHEIEFSPPIEATDLVIVAGLRESPVTRSNGQTRRVSRTPAPRKPAAFRSPGDDIASAIEREGGADATY